MKIILCDINEELIAEWQKQFTGFKEVSVVYGDIFSLRADALVAPGNCQGFMSGGLDKLIAENYEGIQEKVLEKINKKYGINMNVGDAEVIETGYKEGFHCQYIIYTPTMSISLEHSIKGLQRPSPYDTMLGILAAIEEFNLTNRIKGTNSVIESVIIPGLGTGNANVPAKICAEDMREAYSDLMLLKN